MYNQLYMYGQIPLMITESFRRLNNKIIWNDIHVNSNTYPRRDCYGSYVLLIGLFDLIFLIWHIDFGVRSLFN